MDITKYPEAHLGKTEAEQKKIIFDWIKEFSEAKLSHEDSDLLLGTINIYVVIETLHHGK
jgi:hypothetical protein